MALKDELVEEVAEFAHDKWGDIPDAYVVPDPEDLSFGNTAKRMDVCVLYADVHGSTKMVDELLDTLAAEYYKAFLHCSAKLIKLNDGTVQAYDGDRVMGIYVGDGKGDRAVITAMQVNWAMIN